ncbi:MAG: type II toxin-antitoxin system PemK/MazF family toxin [Candidatus Atribacteria bacterium]|nr:MAG: type II toxin-antitoxin system PemK/MazF family toxin [Candidatus Atribacteria bacterium]
MKQGEIYLINLDPSIHSEIGKTRPGVILSVNAMNLNSPRLIIAPITSSVGKIYPFEVLLAGWQATAGGLDKDSKIMLDQMRSVDKRRLTRRIGVVDHELLIKACTIAQKLINAPSAGSKEL